MGGPALSRLDYVEEGLRDHAVAGDVGVDVGSEGRRSGAAARRERHDASRILADASLAVHHALGVPAEPVLVKPGASDLLECARSCALLVLGFPDRWRGEGLGETRLRLAREADVPVLLVRGGVRPSGIAPGESVTRYTWSLGSVDSA